MRGRRRSQRLATTLRLLAAAAGVLLSVVSAAAQDLGNIMPLGDSITEGTVPGGFRDPLDRLLTQNGYGFHFVGSNTTNPTALLTSQKQTHHEGHSGYVIQAGTSGRAGILDNLPRWLGPSGPHPDLILLMIGTNDVDLNYRLAAAPDRLGSLIFAICDPMTGLRPQAHLIVASITPIGNAAEEARVEAYNAAIPGVVNAHRALGQNVSFVDMHSFLTKSDLADKLHPGVRGYQKMGEAWYEAVTVPEPSADAGLLYALVLLRSGRRGRLTCLRRRAAGGGERAGH